MLNMYFKTFRIKTIETVNTFITGSKKNEIKKPSIWRDILITLNLKTKTKTLFLHPLPA